MSSIDLMLEKLIKNLPECLQIDEKEPLFQAALLQQINNLS